MIVFTIFPVELAFLFFLSRVLTRSVSEFFLRITKNKNTAIYLFSFLFLPGVIVHELSHLLTASLLFVPVGEIEFMPKVSGDEVKLGSVAVAKTDPIRRAIIGAAPFIIGVLIILSSLFYFTKLNFPISQTIKVILELFIVFEIGNTMFSSSKDLEGTLELLVVILLIMGMLFFIGLRVPQAIPDYFSSPATKALFGKIDLLILVPIGLDLLVIGWIKLLRKSKSIY